MTGNRIPCGVWMPALLGAALYSADAASAQTSQHRFTIDERWSLSWWQVSPHLNHLWATTCSEDPSWQPGDERSSGWVFDPKKAPPQYHANIVDTIHVPLFPRPAGEARPICTPAVSGEMIAADTTTWRDVHGHVAIRADAFITGLTARDRYAARAVLQSGRYPTIGFRVDSLIDVQPGDTLMAKAAGHFELRGVSTPMVVPVKAWMEGDGLRVIGKFTIPASDMIEVYEISQLSMGLGVGTGIWKFLHLGFDVVLRPQEP
jgi:YceI-like protein